ncbi:MAG: winged helix-turn-helix transcriptional regulator [Bacteroidales bacterium]|nr:winged helix-turn-helix transcriptional regulator [Bacteroidales bacterium]
MNNSITTLKKIVELFEIYTENKNDSGIEDFVLWLNKYLFTENITNSNNQHSPDIHLTFLVSLLNKHYKNYTRRIFVESEISNAESYSFLYHLYLTDSLRKMELINMHQLEAPTGIEILKRLLSKKMISEFDDPNDKRAKRISITKKGNEEIEKLHPEMEKIYKLMGGNLNLNEKIRLVSDLSELNNFHNMKNKNVRKHNTQ